MDQLIVLQTNSTKMSENSRNSLQIRHHNHAEVAHENSGDESFVHTVFKTNKEENR